MRWALQKQETPPAQFEPATHAPFREQPLQHAAQSQPTPVGIPPQLEDMPSGLQQVAPQVPLQHSPAQAHEPPLPTQAPAPHEPPLQTWGQLQLPQFTVREVPQLSGAVLLLQFFPRREQKVVFDSGVQTQVLVALQVSAGATVQVPQLATVRDTPQASLAVTGPQFLPRRRQNATSVSWQPQVLAMPAPPQVSGPSRAAVPAPAH